MNDGFGKLMFIYEIRATYLNAPIDGGGGTNMVEIRSRTTACRRTGSPNYNVVKADTPRSKYDSVRPNTIVFRA